ncbi:YpiB family protein [Aerococcaceae bacterium DSM 111020]|nr:YpiB family protein [Aerococcaceae bacterium DSM 111020]
MTSKNWQKYEIISLLMQQYKNFNREVYYLLKWIIDETTLVEKIEFTKHSNYTPRGLKLQFNSQVEKPFTYFKNKLVYFDFDQIIHDLRVNQNDVLYIELVLADDNIEKLIDEIKIDNPFVPGYRSFEEKMDGYLNQISRESYVEHLEKSINDALEDADYQQLEVLANLLAIQKEGVQR